MSYRRAFSIYWKEDVLFQLKIRGALEKFKNQPRPVLRPRSVNLRLHFQNLSRKTVPLILSRNLKVPSGQIGSSWEWNHWIGIEKDINRYRFSIFYFSFEYLKRFQSPEQLHTKMPLVILLVGITGCMGTNCDFFRCAVLQKSGRVNNCSWDYSLWVKKTNNLQSKPK